MENGRKAWFKIKKTIGLYNACDFLEKLFDTLISPIILYGSKVGGGHIAISVILTLSNICM
jgi:hypothetical protein